MSVQIFVLFPPTWMPTAHALDGSSKSNRFGKFRIGMSERTAQNRICILK